MFNHLCVTRSGHTLILIKYCLHKAGHGYTPLDEENQAIKALSYWTHSSQVMMNHPSNPNCQLQPSVPKGTNMQYG